MRVRDKTRRRVVIVFGGALTTIGMLTVYAQPHPDVWSEKVALSVGTSTVREQERNGGDDGARTRDLRRDRFAF